MVGGQLMWALRHDPVSGELPAALVAASDTAQAGELAHAVDGLGIAPVLAFDPTRLLALFHADPNGYSVIVLGPGLTDDPRSLVSDLRSDGDAMVVAVTNASGPTGAHAEARLPPATPAATVTACVVGLLAPHADRLRRTILQWGPLRLDPTRHRAFWHATAVPLTSQQVRILERLMTARGAVVTTRQLTRSLDGGSPVTDPRRIRAHVLRLRGRLESAAPRGAQVIQTVHGHGYRLVPATSDTARQPEPNGTLQP